MRIVDTRREHVPALASLMAASPLLKRYGVTRESARRSLVEALRAGDLLHVAIEGGDVVGFAWTIPTRALDSAAYLRLLLVAGGRQSHGIGATLLARAERAARTAGCRHLVLLVTTTNRRARAFYVRHGYRHLGDLPSFARPGVDESLYVKTLPSRRAGG